MRTMIRRRLASLTCLLALACTPTAEISDPPSTTTTTDQPSTTTAEQPSSTTDQPSGTTDEPSTDEQPSTDATNAIDLAESEKTLTVPTGTELRYSYKSHASVGLGASFEIGNPAVLEHLRTDKDYKQSEAEREGKAGADAATGTFVFKAGAPGSTTLEVHEQLRGKQKLLDKYEITVVAP